MSDRPPRRRAAQASLDSMLNLRAIEQMSDANGIWLEEESQNVVDLTADTPNNEDPEEPADQPPEEPAEQPSTPPVEIPPPPVGENHNDDEDEPTGGFLEPDFVKLS